jgi:hypothetical protein
MDITPCPGFLPVGWLTNGYLPRTSFRVHKASQTFIREAFCELLNADS